MSNLETLELKVSNANALGLDKKKSKELSKKLNTLLASYSVFYQNVRGYHWNLKGEEFFQLHVKFEELYGSLYLKIDEIAERVLTLGYPANHNFSDYAAQSKIKESPCISDGQKAAENILDSLQIILSQQREILSLSNEMNDEGTYSLISENIRTQEKMIWMYSSYLER